MSLVKHVDFPIFFELNSALKSANLEIIVQILVMFLSTSSSLGVSLPFSINTFIILPKQMMDCGIKSFSIK